MDFTKVTSEIIKCIRKEARRMIKRQDIRVSIKGRTVDVDSIKYSEGEIEINIDDSLYSYDTNEWATIDFCPEEPEEI